MFKNTHQFSVLTTILPHAATQVVADELVEHKHLTALMWRARGTLLHEHWLKKFVPPVSPTKTMMQMIVPQNAVDSTLNKVVDIAKLNYQATGAVFCSPRDNVFVGEDFPLPEEESLAGSTPVMDSGLYAIYCIVSPRLSDRISKAAIDAGAHGPIVFLSEGRGLRDRLGWLRITKEHDKEVMLVVVDGERADTVFSSMAKAGQLHLPGRGFMYQSAVDRGLFNLPSRAGTRQQEASLQQIIAAIDHLQGHDHWRDRSAHEVGDDGIAAGISLQQEQLYKLDQFRLFSMVTRSQLQPYMDLLLDNGAPGLNFNVARALTDHDVLLQGESHLSEEYAIVRCIADATTAEQLAAAIETEAAGRGVTDLCASVCPVARVATYVPGRAEFRQAS